MSVCICAFVFFVHFHCVSKLARILLAVCAQLGVSVGIEAGTVHTGHKP